MRVSAHESNRDLYVPKMWHEVCFTVYRRPRRNACPTDTAFAELVATRVLAVSDAMNPTTLEYRYSNELERRCSSRRAHMKRRPPFVRPYEEVKTMKVGIFTDYPSQSVQSGPAIHTRFLKENLERHGHEVLLIGPDTTGNGIISNSQQHLFKGVPYPTHPKTKVVMPWPLRQLPSPPRVDIIHGQVNSHMIHYGAWMRKMWRIPMLNTHILHLPTHSHFLVGDALYKNPWVRAALEQTAYGVEQSMAKLANEGDAFIVQSRYMIDYWRERGVTVPIEVVGRPINPANFSKAAGVDPYPKNFKHGKRLVVVCRHDREKSLDELIEIFDEHIAEADPEMTLTLVGDGADHQNLLAQAKQCRHANRIYFTGEVEHGTLVDWYSHADLFVYTSISETFGNVVNEALWCGLPCVAYDDRMGVAHQVQDQVNGFLVQPGRTDSHASFAAAVLTIASNRTLMQEMGQQAATIARQRSHPDVIIRTFEKIYENATRRCHDEIQNPLSDQSRARQLAELAKSAARWSAGHATVLAVAKAATSVGAGRIVRDDTAVAGTAADAPAHQDFVGAALREAAE